MLAAAFVLYPLSVSATDLLSAYRSALENDSTFRAATARYRAALQRLPQARAALLPGLSATAAVNKNHEEVVTESPIFSRPAGRARYTSDELRLTLTQPLYNAVAWANLRQATAQVRQAEAEFQQAKQDLILRTAEAYLAVLLAQDTLALAQSERTALAKNLEVVQGRKAAGFASIIDVNDARARLEATVAQEIEARNALDDQRQALREMTGTLYEQISRLTEDTMLPRPSPPLPDAWVESAITNNPAVRAAAEAVEVARENIAKNRGAHYPVVEAIGSRTYMDAEGSIPGPAVRSGSSVIGLQVRVALFQGGAVSAAAEEAVQLHQAAIDELQARRRAAERAARRAFQGTESGAARIAALREAIAAAESALAAKLEGRSLGLYTTLDILDSTRELYRSKREYAEARVAYLRHYLQLKSAAGRLTEDDVIAVNRLLTSDNASTR